MCCPVGAEFRTSPNKSGQVQLDVSTYFVFLSGLDSGQVQTNPYRSHWCLYQKVLVFHLFRAGGGPGFRTTPDKAGSYLYVLMYLLAGFELLLYICIYLYLYVFTLMSRKLVTPSNRSIWACQYIYGFVPRKGGQKVQRVRHITSPFID